MDGGFAKPQPRLSHNSSRQLKGAFEAQATVTSSPLTKRPLDDDYLLKASPPGKEVHRGAAAVAAGSSSSQGTVAVSGSGDTPASTVTMMTAQTTTHSQSAADAMDASPADILLLRTDEILATDSEYSNSRSTHLPAQDGSGGGSGGGGGGAPVGFSFPLQSSSQ